MLKCGGVCMCMFRLGMFLIRLCNVWVRLIVLFWCSLFIVLCMFDSRCLVVVCVLCMCLVVLLLVRWLVILRFRLSVVRWCLIRLCSLCVMCMCLVMWVDLVSNVCVVCSLELSWCCVLCFLVCWVVMVEVMNIRVERFMYMYICRIVVFIV